MSIKSDLKREGIKVTNQLNTYEVNSIAETIAEKLSAAFPNHNFETTDLFKRLSSLNMYTAKLPNGLSEANYFYKNTSIYYNEKIELSNIYRYALHECIHYLQEDKKSNGKLLKLGLCDLSKSKIQGLAINEAAVQLATSIALNNENDTVKYYGITFETISPSCYPLECNLINQMAYITGRDVLFDSTFFANNNFKNKFIELTSKEIYYTIQNNFDTILYSEEELIKLNNKLELGESNNSKKINMKIANLKKLVQTTFIETQNLIFTSYFNKAFEKISSLDQIENFRKCLYNFKNYIGITDDYYYFNNYYISMMENLEKKYLSLENNDYIYENNISSLIVPKKNLFIEFLKVLKNLLLKPGNEYVREQK